MTRLMVNFGLWLCRKIWDDYLWVVVVVVELILGYGYNFDWFWVVVDYILIYFIPSVIFYLNYTCSKFVVSVHPIKNYSLTIILQAHSTQLSNPFETNSIFITKNYLLIKVWTSMKILSCSKRLFLFNIFSTVTNF